MSMFELVGHVSNIAMTYGSSKPSLIIEVEENASSLFQIVDELRKHEKVSIKFDKIGKKRSLDANAYFHLLVNRIAAKTGLSDDETKKWLVKSYGTLARDENGNLIGAMLPAGVDVERFHPYAKDYKTEYRDGKEYTCYLFYERTRDLDTTQMSHLIDGTVQEAKNLGIETLRPEQLSIMKEAWRGNS